MDATLKLWSVVAIVGALNYLSRLSFIALFARRHIPSLLVRAFRYVPAAMLTALVVPMVVAAPGEASSSAMPKIVAAGLAGIVASRTRSTPKTLGAGMLTLWVLQALSRVSANIGV
jgi:branched-subunit amino acid transport protein